MFLCQQRLGYGTENLWREKSVSYRYKQEKWKKGIMMAGLMICCYAILDYIGKKKKNEAAFEKSPKTENQAIRNSVYETKVKRILDKGLAFVGLLILMPIYGMLSLIIFIDDPGPVLFAQKRVGKDKQFFMLHKFRSMKMKTPHDVPTHQLENPEQYITRVGKFLRKYSLDELPQIWDIFVGNMSIIGPRPALWNQEDLVTERDKYGANNILPGLTGWAQINGRDELEIADKAKLDGEYCRELHKSNWHGFKIDCRCFFGTIKSVLSSDGVVEGGTGSMENAGRHFTDAKTNKELIGKIGFGEFVEVDKQAKKKVLITGTGSYIGESFAEYAKTYYADNFEIDAIDMRDDSWKERDFSEYGIIYHVAGIAHADVGSVSEGTKEKYYAVNTDLAIETAKKAKREGVQEFVFMSSMIVYGDSAPYGKEKIVDKHTVPVPSNFYGDSKLQADVAVRELADDRFKVIVLRPPMIYGRGSKGNYPTLARFAKKLPVFPDVDNKRSMLHIDNLCEFLCQIMLIKEIKQNATVLIPQNAEWTKTADMVQKIAKVSGKNIIELKVLRAAVAIGSKMPGKISGLVNKAFGNSCYAHDISKYPGINYQNISLSESIARTEGNISEKSDAGAGLEKAYKKHILVVSQYFYPEQFRVNDICQEWVNRGYKVTVLTGIPNYPQGEFYEGYDYIHNRTETWNGIDIIRLPIKPRKTGIVPLALNYLSFVTEGRKWVQKADIDADEVFIYEVSPMTQALAGVWYAEKHHVKCNLYVTDLWPENVEIVLGVHNKLFLGAIGIMVDYIYKRCDYIFTSSKSFIGKISTRGIDKNKLVYWPQYAEEFYQKIPKGDLLEIPDDDVVNLTFAGNFGTAQGLDVLVDAASVLKNESVKVRFNMIGEGRYENVLKDHIERAGVKNYFNFIPQKPAETISEYFAWSDAALITLSKSEIYAMTIPAKTQSCLACGVPILVSADGEVQNIIREAGCGFCSDSGDALKLADNIKLFIALSAEEREKLSINALNYYRENFDKKSLMDKMEAYI